MPLKKSLNYKISSFSFKKDKSYHKYPVYAIQFFDQNLASPKITLLYRTKESLNKILAIAEKKQLLPLICPNPISIPKGFWKLYKESKTLIEKGNLINSFNLLKDEKIYELKRIVLDIDSDFVSVYKIWEILRNQLQLKNYYIYITKSGRFRAILNLEPQTIVINNKQQKKIITSFYKPFNKSKTNKKTNLEILKEILCILLAFFEKHKLNPDLSFVYRINHPFLIDHYFLKDGRVTSLHEKNTERGYTLYELYRKVKQFQKKEKLYSLKGLNLTKYFWQTSLKKNDCSLNNQPNKINNNKYEPKSESPHKSTSKNFTVVKKKRIFEEAVKRLAQKHTEKKFIHIMFPSVGWAKYLKLSKAETKSILQKFLPDKKNFDRDFEIAWEKAKEIKFKTFKKTKITEQNEKKLINQVIFYIASEGKIERQKLIKDVFKGQVWLAEDILRKLEKYKILSFTFEKQPQKGRPKKIYFFSKNFYFSLYNNSHKRAFLGGGWFDPFIKYISFINKPGTFISSNKPLNSNLNLYNLKHFYFYSIDIFYKCFISNQDLLKNNKIFKKIRILRLMKLQE